MRILKGIAASAGIGTGKSFLYVHEKLVIPRIEIEGGLLEDEKQRFHTARTNIDQELNDTLIEVTTDEHRKILETHLMMLQDPEFISLVEHHIDTHQITSEWAVEKVLTEYVELLDASEDPDTEGTQGRYLRYRMAHHTKHDGKKAALTSPV